MARLLIVGAMRSETLPLLGALRAPRPLSARMVAGTLDGRPVAVLTCGVGPDKAARRTADALARADVDAVLSIGTCGSLRDHLTLGDVITADVLSHDGAACPPPTPWPAATAGAVITVREPVWSADRRASLAAKGSTVCEMEAAAVQAASGGRAFSALKVVSDQAGGHPDDPPGRPGPAAIARFKARALRLCQGPLLAALRAGLQAM